MQKDGNDDDDQEFMWHWHSTEGRHNYGAADPKAGAVQITLISGGGGEACQL